MSYMSESMFCKQISKKSVPLIYYYQNNISYVDGMFVDDALEAVGLVDHILALRKPETLKINRKNIFQKCCDTIHCNRDICGMGLNHFM